MSENLKVEWIDRGFAPLNQPNPAYPDGVRVDVSGGRLPCCDTDLPYPARRCGYWLVTCSLCDLSCLLTTAGRPDDPRSIKVACKLVEVAV
jgi:hypothetical protein